MIFEHLDADDLANCELVCERWRVVLGPGPFWRNALCEQIVSSPMWLKVYRAIEIVDLDRLNAQHFKEIYKIFNQCVKEIEENWRSLQLSATVISSDDDFDWNYLTVDDDFCACLYEGGDEVVYFKLPSLEVTNSVEIDPAFIVQILEDMVISVHDNKIKIYDSDTEQLVQELHDEGWEFTNVCVGNGLMASFSENRQLEDVRLTVWSLKNPLETTRLKEWNYEGHYHHLDIDEFYIFTRTARVGSETAAVHFISTKTLEMERSMSLVNKGLCYGQGLLLVVDHEKRGKVRILHVTSGSYFHDFNIQDFNPYLAFSFNSKYLAVINTNKDVLKVNLYDIKSRIPSIDSEIPLLASVEVPSTVYDLSSLQSWHMDVWMNETRLICHATPRRRYVPEKLLLLDFAVVPLLRAELHSCLVSASQGN